MEFQLLKSNDLSSIKDILDRVKNAEKKENGGFEEIELDEGLEHLKVIIKELS